jgi:hypothetical protein
MRQEFKALRRTVAALEKSAGLAAAHLESDQAA